MAKPQISMVKRQREQAKRERRERKAERKAQRKLENDTTPENQSDDTAQ